MQDTKLTEDTNFDLHNLADWKNVADAANWKTAAFVAATALISGGAGFMAARASTVPSQPSEADAEQGRAAAPASDGPASAAAQPASDSGSLTVPALESNPSSFPTAAAAEASRSPSRDLTPEEMERNQRIAELQARRDAAQERRNELLAQREQVDKEVQPALQEVDTELKEIGARVEAERQGFTLNKSVEDFEAVEKARQADAEAQRAVSGVYESVIPMVLQGQRIETLLSQRLSSVQERVPKLIREEMTSGFSELATALEGRIPGIGRMMTFDDMPTLSLTVAGLAAPTQLKWMYGENITRLAVAVALLILDGVAVGADWNMGCVTWIFGYHGRFLRPWLEVDMISLAFTVLIRVMAHRQISSTFDKIDAFEHEPLDLPADDPQAAFRLQLERQLLIGAQAMLQYDRVANQGAFKLLDVLPVFDFIWQAGGIALLFDTPAQFCEAQILMQWSRVRGIIFLIGFIPALIGLALVLLKAAVASESSCMAVLKAAHEADKSIFPNGPPLVTLLVRAFLVRDTTDMQAMELQVIDFEKKIAVNERERLKKEYEAAVQEAQAQADRYAAQSEAVGHTTQEEQFMKQYAERMQRQMRTVSDEVERAEALLASTAAASASSAVAAVTQETAVGGLEEQTSAAAASSEEAGVISTTSAVSGALGVDGDGGTGSLSTRLRTAGLPAPASISEEPEQGPAVRSSSPGSGASES